MKYPDSIVFAKHQDAIVSTRSIQNFRDFLNQRKRWTAKSSKYKDLQSIYTSYLVLFTNLLLLLLFFSTVFFNNYFHLFIIFYGLKFIVDIWFLYPILKFFKRLDLIKWIFPFELFYAFYIVLIVVLSFTGSFEWKGRKYKK